ncbi:hypothetical protein [Achromobacter xylosoxidans]|uniref:hypothetical protein n=1 Tax=Alcaligenes xylosoxydans xylosoxydans TaxID=85698 RepID=UPI000970DFD4|nr:hypothetical protein [Achromobacter xylosoxidans]OMG80607.1 hypothetical protein BIZ53_30410 [Achromobacter xylosoxidans]
MKYAKEVMDLMAAYPGRQFRMQELVRYVDPRAAGNDRHRIRTGVQRVLDQLAEVGTLEKREAGERGSFALYSWVEKVTHEHVGKRYAECNNLSGLMRP